MEALWSTLTATITNIFSAISDVFTAVSTGSNTIFLIFLAVLPLLAVAMRIITRFVRNHSI